MKYYGKEKCRILKEIRAEIARENGIEWAVSECKHKGNCKGTCPKCEQEVRQLEEALARREALGKKVAVVGISASIALSVTGCVNPFPQTQGDMVLEGEPMPPDTTAEETCTAIAGEILSTETAASEEIPTPGEPLPDTEDPFMGEPTEPAWEETDDEPVWEGEYIEEETTSDTTDEEEEFGELMGAVVAPVEKPTEPETEEEPLMGEPAE